LLRVLLADVIGRCNLPAGGAAAGQHKAPALGAGRVTRHMQLREEASALVRVLHRSGWVADTLAASAEVRPFFSRNLGLP